MMKLTSILKEAFGSGKFSRDYPFFYYGNTLSRINGDVEVIEVGTSNEKDRINIYDQREQINDELLIHDVRLLVKSLEMANGEVELMANYSCEVDRKVLYELPFHLTSLLVQRLMTFLS